MAEGITILLFILFLLGCGVVYLKWQSDKQFGIWFDEVLKQAPSYGFTPERIDDFEEIFWYDYYLRELSAEEAIKQYLADN